MSDREPRMISVCFSLAAVLASAVIVAGAFLNLADDTMGWRIAGGVIFGIMGLFSAVMAVIAWRTR